MEQHWGDRQDNSHNNDSGKNEDEEEKEEEECFRRKSLAESDLDLLRVYTLKVEDHLSDHTFNRLPRPSQIQVMTPLKGLRSVFGCLLDSSLCDTNVV